ncbi:hypothetical protein BT96DRAFT_807403 [Gymnopus androsaceus JB14]|uniref:F-box domain-containing protein n=1 Tax=Gymnopus androsaceus JB14 TaxID=1447944 RepID=A0A6A4I9X3_9AGAR|nr:hypothetical protein BT96DRAFT_807403 [Gymnopus androsaceus JB14]
MFSVFTFPSLGELIICSEDGSTPNLIWPLDAFSAFISRLACTLTMLSLSSVTVFDLDLIADLNLLPSLINFSIDGLLNPEGGSPITSRFLSSLTLHDSGSPLLPKLRFLSIKLHGASFDDVAFVRMVSSRWLPDPACAAVIGMDCLRSVVLHFEERGVDENTYTPLYDLDRKGMQVVITGNGANGIKT